MKIKMQKMRALASLGIFLFLAKGGLAQTVSRFADPGFRLVESGKAVLEPGDCGSAVAVLQTVLQDMGFAVQTIDGKYGIETENALEDYQAHLGFPPTGRLDARTLAVLEMQAPPPGEKLWEMDDPKMIPDPVVYLQGKREVARIMVVTSERRTFLFSKDGKLLQVFPDAVGRDDTPTNPGLRFIAGKLDEKKTAAWGLQSSWKNPNVFGICLLDLSEIDPVTGKVSDTPQELHGTYDRSSIGTAASHGCIRHFNEDIARIYQNVQWGDLVLVQARWGENNLAGQQGMLAGK